MRKLTSEEFIERARIIHSDKYDYSKVVYRNARALIVITCPIHGDFKQNPNSHLHGCGCKKCAVHCVKQKNRGLVYGKGILDVNFSCKKDSVTAKAYKVYGSMLGRCYDESHRVYAITYKDCTVCDEWLRFSNFKKWFDENYVEGYALDKDILVKGNKVYSPETCCFVPREINSLLTNRRNHRNGTIGSYKTKSGKFIVHCNKYGKPNLVGFFTSEKEAFDAYKKTKESYIKDVAKKYYNEGKITERVYDALMRYEIEITD